MAPNKISPIIVLITGIQGSGKTWLCDKINTKGIKCIDTDDILLMAYESVNKNPETKKLKSSVYLDSIFKYASKLVKNIIEEYKDSRIIIFAGISLKIENADFKFFISIPEQDIESTYRRTFVREYNKIIDGYDKINRILDVSPIDHIMINIDFETGNALNKITFYTYNTMYKSLLSKYKSEGFKVKPQMEILEIINNINVLKFRRNRDYKYGKISFNKGYYYAKRNISLKV